MAEFIHRGAEQSGYAIRSVCACGWWHTPWHGSEFFSRCDYPCCPDCGRTAEERLLIAARAVKVPRRWWQRTHFRLDPAPHEQLNTKGGQ